MNRLKLILPLCMAALWANGQNPFSQTEFTADPAPLVVNDTLYVYTGHDEWEATPDRFVMKDYLCFTTTDMVNWTHHAPIFNVTKQWPYENANASQMAYRNGKYYFYPSTSGVPVLTSDSPYGPFTNALGESKNLIYSEDTNYSGHGWEDIDPTVFIDDDNQAYLYWGNNALYAVKLNEDMVSYSDTIKVFDITDKGAFGSDYEEAPWLTKYNGKYYLIYAAHVPEHTYWSWADTPLGPWTYGGVVMRAFEHGGMGNHTGMAPYKGQWYFFYMDEGLPDAHSRRRTASVVPFNFEPDGKIPYIHHDKRGVLKSVDPLNPYVRQQGETIAWEEGIGIGYDGVHTVYVNNVDNGDYIKVREVNFGDGAKSFSATTRTVNPSARIELHLDAPNGEHIGTLEPATGDSWTTATCEVKRRDGIHDLYFVFTGEGSDLLDFDHWIFSK